MAVIRLPRTNRLFLIESECHTLCILDEIHNFRDRLSHRISSEDHKYIKIQRSKIASYSYPDIKHLHETLKANLTEEKHEPRAQLTHFPIPTPLPKPIANSVYGFTSL